MIPAPARPLCLWNIHIFRALSSVTRVASVFKPVSLQCILLFIDTGGIKKALGS